MMNLIHVCLGRYFYSLVFNLLIILVIVLQADALSWAWEIRPPKGTVQTVCYDKKGHPLISYEDADGDGRFESRVLFQDGQMVCKEEDNDGNGRPEIWQYYSGEKLERIEEDRNRDGKVDLKIFLDDSGRRREIQQDDDYDGHFELVQKFDQPPWSRVVTMNSTKAGAPAITLFYKGDHLVKRFVYADKDGLPDSIEFFGEDGLLKERCDFHDDGRHLTGPCPIHYFFDTDGRTVVRAERDADGDGKPEEWFFYQGGKLVKVHEDSNGDGMPDIWETYDAGEHLVKREKDLDYDGKPDLHEGVK